MAGEVCANHQDTKEAIGTLFRKVDNHEVRIDVLEQGGVLRTEQISTLCQKIDQTNDQVEKFIAAIGSGVRYIITTLVAIMAIIVPVIIWTVDKIAIIANH